MSNETPRFYSGGEAFFIALWRLMTPQKFLNDVIKPYDELNFLLVQRLAFEPDLSDVTRMATAVAVALRHIPEFVGTKSKNQRQTLFNESFENQIIADVADGQKHEVSLERKNTLLTGALFEWCPPKGFRFIRNSLFINHARFQEHDFLKITLDAIQYWIQKLNFSISWKGSGAILEAPAEFHPTAFLFYDPKYCISMKNTRFRFFSRTESKMLVAIDPDEVRMEIYEKGEQKPKAWFTLRKKELLEKRKAGIKTWQPAT